MHKSTPYNEIKLQTALQAVAMRVGVDDRIISICNVYIPGSQALEVEDLMQLINQLPPPIMLLGDFNAHSEVWGSSRTDTRGRKLERVMLNAELNILNDGTPTRIEFGSETAIDLSIVSPELDDVMRWMVMPSPGDSDHCPIIMSLASRKNEGVPVKQLNIKKADWKAYSRSDAWQQLPAVRDMSNEEAIKDMYARIETATENTIPTFTVGKYFPKQWWSSELKESRKRRERAYFKYRKRKSYANLIEWKKLRAHHKQLVLKEKKESWKNYTETLNKNTTSTEVFRKIRQIKGKHRANISILIDDNRMYSKTMDIVNKIGNTFQEIWCSENYTEEFKEIKRTEESKMLDFTSNNSEDYNSLFSMYEMEKALKKTKNSSPGPDRVYYQMIRAMPDEAKEYLLTIINKFWQSSFLPNKWKQSYIIPIAKPGKNHTIASNYRPIALTSCLGKTVERMVNERLVQYLEVNGLLSPIQCGCHKGRSTVDHLVRLETEVRRAYAFDEHMISIFYDLEKAYDLTWRYGILRDLFNLGVRGRMAGYIEQFLLPQKFQVRMDGVLSDEYIQETGVPQGGVLSVTLFAVKIRDITDCIKKDNRMLASLYVDDLQVSFRHTDLNVIKHNLQETVKKIETWCNNNGYKFLLDKTKAVHFVNRLTMALSPTILPYNRPISYVNEMKFLGIVFDNKLTFASHIAKLKADCTKSLNLMRSVSSNRWGADQYTLMKIYRALIRTKLDYGCVIYSTASETLLKSLDSIANEALRIATAAFKTTPSESLYILANELPMHYRRKLMTAKYFCKLRSQLGNPAFKYAVPNYYGQTFEAKRLTPPFSIRARNILKDMEITNLYIKAAFSYQIYSQSTPAWKIDLPEVNLAMVEYPKNTTTSGIYRQVLASILEEHSSELQIYTDGSKSEGGVGSAVVCEGRISASSLPSCATILSAELYAITIAVNQAKNSNKDCVILSDSYSALMCLQDRDNENPTVKHIQYECHNLKQRNKRLVFYWIPSHMGIYGNEMADQAAKLASTRPHEYIPVFYKDWHPILTSKVNEWWNQRWREKRQKLYFVKESAGQWRIPGRINRAQEVIINRLRCGHTRLTHGYLMDNEVHDVPSICSFCNNAILTVRHIFVDCEPLRGLRERFFGEVNVSIAAILGDNIDVDSVFKFLKILRIDTDI